MADFDGEFNLRWRAFQLEPGTPRESRPLLTWLGAKFGGEQRARQMMAHVTSTAAAAGLRLDFDRALIANSFDAHRLLWLADQPETVLWGATADTQPELADALHRAHFTNGLDIGSFDVLVDLADEVGLDRTRVRDYLHSTMGVAEVRTEIARAQHLGITSVPTFIFAGKYEVCGAQETATFAAVLREVAEREGLALAMTPPIPHQRTAPAIDGDSRVT